MKTAESATVLNWLKEIGTGKGPVSIQSSVRKVLKECPEWSIDRVLEQLEPKGFEEEGRAYSEELKKSNIHYVSIFDEAYPLLLRQIEDPPLFLFYSGKLSVLHRPCVSIIGARTCTTYGIQTARQIASELAGIGFTVVSGLALGIDAVAHEAALNAHGRTAAVLGSGIRVIYPKQHTLLARNIVKQHGIVVTEFPPTLAPKPHHFPMRNRIISGLSRATIVVEAEKKSGTLITAQFCLDQNRELFAVPGPVNRPTSQGTHQLILNGEAHIFTSVKEFLSHFDNLISSAAYQEKQVEIEINDPIMRKIYDSLDAFESTCFDSLLAELGPSLGLTPGKLGAKLTEMETRELITVLHGQNYLRNPINLPGETSS